MSLTIKKVPRVRQRRKLRRRTLSRLRTRVQSPSEVSVGNEWYFNSKDMKEVPNENSSFAGSNPRQEGG